MSEATDFLITEGKLSGTFGDDIAQYVAEVRDGNIDIRVAANGDDTVTAAVKHLYEMMLVALLGEDWQLPENYRMYEMESTPAGRPALRCALEILAPGGRASHHIRGELEAEVARLQLRIEELESAAVVDRRKEQQDGNV